MNKRTTLVERIKYIFDLVPDERLDDYTIKEMKDICDGLRISNISMKRHYTKNNEDIRDCVRQYLIAEEDNAPEVHLIKDFQKYYKGYISNESLSLRITKMFGIHSDPVPQKARDGRRARGFKMMYDDLLKAYNENL